MAEDTPGPAGILERPRLNRILDSALVRVCIVQGPSGSGKTTLLRSWSLRQQGDRAITWVSLGTNTMSRSAFWRHVLSSAKRLGELSPETATRVAEQLDATADPVQVAAPRLAGHGPTTLILDAYEHLGDATYQVDEDLARLIAAVPELQVFISTRGHTSLVDLAPPGGVVRVIALRELALTPDEVGDLLAAQTGIRDRRLARMVASASHGFPLTVRAAALALAQLGTIPRIDSRQWHSVMAARFESLLPDPLTAPFVVATSVPPYVDAELAERLTGMPNATQLLDTLETAGFGRWIPYARGHAVFQYVETVRDTFRTRASENGPAFVRCCIDTAHWLWHNDDVDQALQYAIEGGDFAFADRIFVALVIDNPDAYITDRFLPALRSIPDAALTEHPMLAFGLGLALAANAVLRLEAPRAFQIAIDSPAQPAYLEPAIDAFTLASMRAVARRETFAFRQSAAESLEVVRSLDAIEPTLLAQYGEHIGTILRQLSYSLLQGGEIEQAIATAQRSVALCISQTARNYSIVYAAGMAAFAGDMARAASFATSVDTDAWPEALRHTYLNGLGVVAAAYSCLDKTDFAGALEILRDVDDYATSEFWPFFTAIMVSARHGLGQAHAEAARVFKELDGPTPPGVGDNVATAHLHATLARAWIASGDLEAAASLLRRQPADSPFLAGARIAALLAEGDDRAAFNCAQELVDCGTHTLRTRADAWTTGAVAALRVGRDDIAWSWLNSAAVTWESYGPRMHVALLSLRDRELLRGLGHERHSASVLRYLDIAAPTAQAGGAVLTLSPRESVVLNALAAHGTIDETAASLVVSPHTVKTQLQSIYRKLGVSSRQAALAVARELGLLG